MDKDVLAEICKQFNLEDHQQRPGGRGTVLTYISVDATIRRMNEALGLNWSWTVSDYDVIREDGQFHVHVNGAISTYNDEDSHTPTSIRSGLGGASGRDLDDTMKTAMAEAFKKAFNMFGGGNYLWVEKWRSRIEAMLSNDTEKMVDWLVQNAVDDGADATPSAVAQYYNVDPKVLATDGGVMELILNV